jgi:hypothetical protein
VHVLWEVRAVGACALGGGGWECMCSGRRGLWVHVLWEVRAGSACVLGGEGWECMCSGR